jgi:hypothetical protein
VLVSFNDVEPGEVTTNAERGLRPQPKVLGPRSKVIVQNLCAARRISNLVAQRGLWPATQHRPPARISRMAYGLWPEVPVCGSDTGRSGRRPPAISDKPYAIGARNRRAQRRFPACVTQSPSRTAPTPEWKNTPSGPVPATTAPRRRARELAPHRDRTASGLSNLASEQRQLMVGDSYE